MRYPTQSQRPPQWLVCTMTTALALYLIAFPARVNAQNTPSQACIAVSANLVTLDNSQAALVNGLLGSLLDTNLNLSVDDLNALAQGDIELDALLDKLQLDLALSDIAATLGADVSLNAVLDAAIAIAQAGSDAALTTALNHLQSQVNGLAGLIPIGTLLDVDTVTGAPGAVAINGLDLISALVQLYNFENIASPTAAITIPGVDLGVGATVGSVDLTAQVLSPPQIICGAAGAQFVAAPIHLLVQTDLVDLDLDLSSLDSALEGLLGVLLDVEVSGQVGDLTLLADIAGGQGILNTVNAVGGAVNAQVTPGIAALYLGQVNSSLAFSRTHVLTAADVDFALLGTLAISVTNTLLNNTTVVAANIGLKSHADADTQSPIVLNFNAPFPAMLSAGADVTVTAALATEIIDNLELNIDSSLGGLLDPLLNSTILPGLDGVLTSQLPGIIDLGVSDLLDPALANLGLGLGGVQLTVLGTSQPAPDLAISKSHAGSFTAGGAGTYTVEVQNVGAGPTFAATTVVDILPTGLTYASHSGSGWSLASPLTGTLAFIYAAGIPAGTTAPPLVLTVNVAAQAAANLTNLASVSTAGDINAANNVAQDLTVITGSVGGGDGVCVAVGFNILSVDATQSALLNPLLGSLLDSELNLSTDNWNGLAGANIGLADTLDNLRATLGLADLDAALNADVTLTQLLTAIEATAQAEGNLAAIGALDALEQEVIGLAGTVHLGDLLNLDLAVEGADEVMVNLLDLLSAIIQLYNVDNVPQPTALITLEGAAIGLGATVGSIQLAAQALAPPTFACGPVGVEFHSAPIRLHLIIDLVDHDLNLDNLDAALEAAISPALNTQIHAELGKLELLADIGGGVGIISAINATNGAVAAQGINGTVTAQVTPGLVTILVGDVDGDVVFDRTHALSLTTDLGFAPIGSLGITVTDAVVGTPAVVVTATIEAKTYTEGSPEPMTLNFAGPFPETQSAGADISAELVTGIPSNLDVNIETSLGNILDPLVDTMILPGLDTAIQPELSAVVDGLFNGALEPLLIDVGIGLGETGVTILGTPDARPDLAIDKRHTGNFTTGGRHTYVIVVQNVGAGPTLGVVTVVDALPTGLAYVSHNGTGWTLSGQSGTSLTFNHSGSLAAGASLPALVLTVGVGAQISGTITNVATVSTSGDITASNNIDFDATLVVAGGSDADGDGVPDPTEDPNDTDGDGTPDYLDPDDDNDGIPTANEDPNGDGNPTNDDTDGDGRPNYLDPDDDGDGVNTEHENPDPNGDDNPDDAQNTDGDGNPDYLDTDDDGDGVFTRFENADPNGDHNPSDAQNTDGEGNPDYLDPDDDNDLKPTISEQADPNGDGNPADAVDSDGDTLPNYLDPNDIDGPLGDQDGDGLTNGQETILGTNPNNRDSDGDGLYDNHEVGPDLNNPLNHDGDGLIDALDPDDDNDTKPTITEQADPNGDGNPADAVDTDGDMISDYLDPNDGDSVIQQQRQYLPFVTAFNPR